MLIYSTIIFSFEVLQFIDQQLNGLIGDGNTLLDVEFGQTELVPAGSFLHCDYSLDFIYIF